MCFQLWFLFGGSGDESLYEKDRPGRWTARQGKGVRTGDRGRNSAQGQEGQRGWGRGYRFIKREPACGKWKK